MYHGLSFLPYLLVKWPRRHTAGRDSDEAVQQRRDVAKRSTWTARRCGDPGAWNAYDTPYRDPSPRRRRPQRV